jgi:DNA-binding transcriptional ArsR family regulator
MTSNGSTVITDVRALKAIAHPLRSRLLTLLRLEGPATATELARRTGESSGATSYHLRQLARYGYIQDAGPRAGRDRRWRATALMTAWSAADFAADPVGRAASEALERRQIQRAVQHFERWMAHRSNADPAWLTAANQVDDMLRLTPSQARALTTEFLTLLGRFRESPPQPQAGERVDLTALYLQVLPVERPEDLE